MTPSWPPTSPTTRSRSCSARSPTRPWVATRRRRGCGVPPTASPLATLTRLFLLQARVDERAADRALAGLLDELVAEGFVERSGGEVVARLDVRPYAADGVDLWVVSDLTPGLDGAPTSVGADHVLGISPAATSLARLTVREPVGDALDLGTGCGVQALHLATHADRVVATDVNQRALWVTRFNLALNDVPTGRVDVRYGLVLRARRTARRSTSSPPTRRSSSRRRPRSGWSTATRGCRATGSSSTWSRPRRTTCDQGAGARCWPTGSIARDQPWDERLAGWVPDDCDALVVQRETLDPAAYVELWLKDAGRHGGPAGARRYDEWLGWFDRQGVEAIGFGWVNLRRRRRGHAAPGAARLALRRSSSRSGRRSPSGRPTATGCPTADADLLGLRLVTRDDVRAGDPRGPGRRGPGVDRAAAAAGPAPCRAGDDRRGGARRCLRRRPERRSDRRRPSRVLLDREASGAGGPSCCRACGPSPSAASWVGS